MRIAVAMSGGMDSTATALLLKKREFDVIGIHMHLHGHSEPAWKSAQKSAAEIGVPIHVVDFRREFSSMVVKPFVEEYARGRTPSPCPVCNRCIKMSLLFDHAVSLGCEKLATGHYARIVQGTSGSELWRGKDAAKDQSYFLFGLTREMLERTMFPLGDFTKAEIREFLKNEGVSVWESAESQELCFIPDNDYRRFLLVQGLEDKPGNIVDSSGKVLGRHSGISRYTVGQRKGLGICRPKPLYVVRIESETGNVVVGPKEETYTSLLDVMDMNLLVQSAPVAGERFDVKVRSTSKAVPCSLLDAGENSYKFGFDEPQSAVSPGQAAVLYLQDRVVGGGRIKQIE